MTAPAEGQTDAQVSKRYDLVTNYRAGSSIEEMEPSDDGEWIRWDDLLAETDKVRREHHEWDKKRVAELQELRAESTRLRAQLAQQAQQIASLVETLRLWSAKADRDAKLCPAKSKARSILHAVADTHEIDAQALAALQTAPR